MIMSGWILPDMYEVQCLSCSTINTHKEALKKYLLNLKKKSFSTYAEIIHEYYKLKAKKQVLDIEDFAVEKLGWIKIINTPVKIVFYSPNSPVEFIVQRYVKLNYHKIDMNQNISIFNVDIPSHELI